jgi:hypothetical protein
MRLPIALLICLGFLAACNKDPAPPPAMPVESAGDAMRKDDKEIAERLAKVLSESEKSAQSERERNERSRYAGMLDAYRAEWAPAVNEVQQTVRSDIEPKLKRLREIRARGDQIETNNCTKSALQLLNSHMDITIDAYTQFSNETGEPSVAVKEKLQQAVNLLPKYDSQIAVCRLK